VAAHEKKFLMTRFHDESPDFMLPLGVMPYRKDGPRTAKPPPLERADQRNAVAVEFPSSSVSRTSI
jgi:hypothetical protein